MIIFAELVSGLLPGTQPTVSVTRIVSDSDASPLWSAG